MFLNLSAKGFSLCLLILLMGVFTMYSYPYPEKENSNYYLGVLENGYPPSLVVSEFRFANAQVVSIKDNMVLFGINEKTKLTTFLKSLPFLKEVYVDERDVKANTSLRKNPMTREFLNLLQRDRLKKMQTDAFETRGPQKTGKGADKIEISASSGMDAKKQAKKPAMSGNMALIDQLIREKANHTKKSTEKKL